MDNTSTFQNTTLIGLVTSLCCCRTSHFLYVSRELNVSRGWCYYIHIVYNISIKPKVFRIPSHLKILVPLCCHKNQSPCSLLFICSVDVQNVTTDFYSMQCLITFRVKMFFLDRSCWLNSKVIVVLRWHDSRRMLICNSFEIQCFKMHRN